MGHVQRTSNINRENNNIIETWSHQSILQDVTNNVINIRTQDIRSNNNNSSSSPNRNYPQSGSSGGQRSRSGGLNDSTTAAIENVWGVGSFQ